MIVGRSEPLSSSFGIGCATTGLPVAENIPFTAERKLRRMVKQIEKGEPLMSTQTRNEQTAQGVSVQQRSKVTDANESLVPPEDKRLPMVGWYDPRQLAQTGVEVAISTIFGRHSDHRLVEAMASGEVQEDFYDYTYHYKDNGKDVCEPDKEQPRDSIWIDYVGDVGDGWNSTYAVAYHLAETGRTFTYRDSETGDEHSEPTQRGELLIFGGDEVYPTASRVMYKERLFGPYETALRRTHEKHPHVFAIPGNHDWYDSLVSFTRLFTSRRWFAGWRTRQTRSYFALKLPHNWWLLGTDVQLGSDIDGPQVAYFENLAKHMQQEREETGKPASVILCHAEPNWIRAAKYEGIDENYSESNLKLLEKRLGKEVAVFIAGDLHHYRRHEALDKSTQKITAGGGGAFLHPTHVGIFGKSLDKLIERQLDEPPARSKRYWRNPEKTVKAAAANVREDRIFDLRACFPPTKESRKICWLNLIFPYLKRNASRTFGVMTAILYLLLTLAVVGRVDDPTLRNMSYDFITVSGTAIQSVLVSTPTLFFVLFTIVGFIFFTDTHLPVYRIIMGGLHGVVHVLAAFFTALIAVSFVSKLAQGGWRLRVPWGSINLYLDARMLLAALLILLGGFVFGSLIMGIYLLLSFNVFGRHGNEAFSSLSVEDWKNFLRMHIDENGDLTIYPIGIRRVPRKWKPREGLTGPELVADDADASAPELIERPIVMRKAAGVETGVQTSSTDEKIEVYTQSSVPS